MEVKKYAPVIIPTLNRYEHFKRCLESLECCTGANYTEVYIALDYPPSDKYRKGWEQIDAYLVGKEKNNGFKKLHVIRRDRNFGVGHYNSNSMSLTREVRQKSDSYIFSEDDNVFSKNFLEYMNKGLMLYEDDMRILGICGYNYQIEFPTSYKNNFYFSRNGSPWGYGTWSNRHNIYKKYNSLDFLGKIIKDKVAVSKLQKERPSTICSIINMLKNNQIYGDSVDGTIVTLEDMYFLMPIISKVKNIGTDGTGVHAKSKNRKKIDFFVNQEIDTDSNFEFTNDIFAVKPINAIEYRMPENKLKAIYKNLIFRIDYFLWLHFNFVPKSKFI